MIFEDTHYPYQLQPAKAGEGLSSGLCLCKTLSLKLILVYRSIKYTIHPHKIYLKSEKGQRKTNHTLKLVKYLTLSLL